MNNIIVHQSIITHLHVQNLHTNRDGDVDAVEKKVGPLVYLSGFLLDFSLGVCSRLGRCGRTGSVLFLYIHFEHTYTPLSVYFFRHLHYRLCSECLRRGQEDRRREGRSI